MMGICLIQKDETSCGAGRHLSGFEFLSFAVASIMYLGDVRREQKRPGTQELLTEQARGTGSRRL